MMRRQSCIRTLLQLLILVALSVKVSQAELDPFWNTNHYEWSAQTVTQNVRVRVTITKQKPRLHLAKLQRPVIQILANANDDDTDYYDELVDLHVGYRRPELIYQTAEIHDDISDEIKIRLLLARIRALEAYRAKWGQSVV